MPLKKQLEFANSPLLNQQTDLSDKVLASQGSSFVGDIIKPGSILPSVIHGSLSSLSELILNSKIFFICLISLIREILNNSIYNSYLLLASGFDLVSSLPNMYSNFKNEYFSLLSYFRNIDTRELWFLEVKMDLSRLLNSIHSTFKKLLEVFKKFYLTSFVFLFLILLGISNLSLSANTGGQSSLFTNFVENNSYQPQSSSLASTSPSDVLQISGIEIEKDNPETKKILSYIVKEGDTLEYIAQLHGVSADSVKFNNGLEKTNLKPGMNLQIPWLDGYIYKSIGDIEPSEIEKIYGIKSSDIIRFNTDVYSVKTKKFKSDSKILIPTKDFDKVLKSNQAEEENRKIQSEQEKQRKALLLVKNEANSLGFINPTSGYITRCTAGHGYPACDIQDRRAKSGGTVAIVAVKSGTITKVMSGCANYRNSSCNGGFGNMLEIDHGGGVTTLYAHFRDISVSTGQKVEQGQVLGSMGNSGNSTGHHLHFEVRVNGRRQDPLLYVPGW